MSNLETQIRAKLEDAKKQLISNYQSVRASGKWANELEIFYNEGDRGYKFGILGANYSGVLENGRKKNTKQDDKSMKAFVGWAGSTFLKQWVKDKGLTISPFAVAWKIAREGIKVPNQHNNGNIISSVINEDLKQSFIELIKNDRIIQIKSDIKTIYGNH